MAAPARARWWWWLLLFFPSKVCRDLDLDISVVLLFLNVWRKRRVLKLLAIIRQIRCGPVVWRSRSSSESPSRAGSQLWNKLVSLYFFGGEKNCCQIIFESSSWNQTSTDSDSTRCHSVKRWAGGRSGDVFSSFSFFLDGNRSQPLTLRGQHRFDLFIADRWNENSAKKCGERFLFVFSTNQMLNVLKNILRDPGRIRTRKPDEEMRAECRFSFRRLGFFFVGILSVCLSTHGYVLDTYLYIQWGPEIFGCHHIGFKMKQLQQS